MEETHPYNQRRTRNDSWKKQEKELSKKFDGKRTPGSGSKPLPFLKGDVRTEKFHIEAKTTKGSTYTLHKATLCELDRESLEDSGRIPLLCIEFENLSPYIKRTDKWAVIPLDILLTLLGENNGTTGTESAGNWKGRTKPHFPPKKDS